MSPEHQFSHPLTLHESVKGGRILDSGMVKQRAAEVCLELCNPAVTQLKSARLISALGEGSNEGKK